MRRICEIEDCKVQHMHANDPHSLFAPSLLLHPRVLRDNQTHDTRFFYRDFNFRDMIIIRYRKRRFDNFITSAFF